MGLPGSYPWWAVRDLNPQPPVCKTDALPIELTARAGYLRAFPAFSKPVVEDSISPLPVLFPTRQHSGQEFPDEQFQSELVPKVPELHEGESILWIEIARLPKHEAAAAAIPATLLSWQDLHAAREQDKTFYAAVGGAGGTGGDVCQETGDCGGVNMAVPQRNPPALGFMWIRFVYPRGFPEGQNTKNR